MVADAIKALGEKITNFTTWWAGLDDTQRRNIVTIAGIVAAIGPVIAILGLVGTAITSVTTIIGVAGPVIAAMTGPVGLVTAGIVALTAGAFYLSKNWKSIWESMQKSGNPIIQGIVTVIEGITKAVQAVAGTVKDVIDWFGRWKEQAKGLQGAVDAAFPTGGGAASGKVTSIGGHASGGYFTTPHIAAIAEQEPEWVVPQSQAGTFAAQMGGSANEALLRELTFQVKQLQQVVMNSGAGVVSAIRG
jgi:phage-related protein